MLSLPNEVINEYHTRKTNQVVIAK